MKWVTRERPKTDRIACPWLIRRCIDPEAEIVYVPKDEVLEVAEREGGRSFDTSGATYTHRDDRCTFEVRSIWGTILRSSAWRERSMLRTSPRSCTPTLSDPVSSPSG